MDLCQVYYEDLGQKNSHKTFCQICQFVQVGTFHEDSLISTKFQWNSGRVPSVFLPPHLLGLAAHLQHCFGVHDPRASRVYSSRAGCQADCLSVVDPWASRVRGSVAANQAHCPRVEVLFLITGILKFLVFILNRIVPNFKLLKPSAKWNCLSVHSSNVVCVTTITISQTSSGILIC